MYLLFCFNLVPIFLKLNQFHPYTRGFHFYNEFGPNHSGGSHFCNEYFRGQHVFFLFFIFIFLRFFLISLQREGPHE